MPLVSGKGPKWSRPLVVNAEKRLTGLAPVLAFLAALVSRRRARRPAPEAREAEPNADS